MEITKIKEMISPRVLKKFEAKLIKPNDLILEANSVNFINFNFDSTNNNYFNFDGFISDGVSTILEQTEQTEQTEKLTIITSNLKDYFNDYLLIFKDIKTQEFYILQQRNSTYSSESPNEQVDVLVAKKLNNFADELNINIFILDNKPTIKIQSNFLINSLNFKNDNVFKKYDFVLTDEDNNIKQYNKIYNLTNVIDLDKNNLYSFFKTLKDFYFFDVKDLKVTNKNLILINEISSNSLKKFLTDFKTIIKNYFTILNSFAGLNEEEVKTFKETIFSEMDGEKYLNYSLNILKDTNLALGEEAILTFYKMCSGFLKTRWCIDGGLTNNHKLLMPFYIENSNNDFYLKSEYFNLKNDLDNSLIISYKDKFKNSAFFKKINEIKESDVDFDGYKLSNDNFKYLTKIIFDNEIDLLNLKQRNNVTTKTLNVKINASDLHNVIESKTVITRDEINSILRKKIDGDYSIQNIELNKISKNYRISANERFTAKNQDLINNKNSYRVQKYFIDFGKTGAPLRNKKIVLTDNQTTIESLYTYSKYETKTASNYRGETRIAEIFIVETYEISVQILLRENENEALPSFIKELEENNFILNNDFNYILEKWTNKTYINLDFNKSNFFELKGIFIPHKIKINEIEENILKTFNNLNITKIYFNYID